MCRPLSYSWDLVRRIFKQLKTVKHVTAKNDNIRIPVALSKYPLAERSLPERDSKKLGSIHCVVQRLNNKGREGRHPLANVGTIVAGRNPVTDGPLVEAKEGIAGFFTIGAESLEQRLR